MLFDGLDKKNNRYMVGYDLGEMASQISFCTLNQNEPETLPIVAGTEEYNIPTVLCKRTEVNQWFYGKEALKHIQDGDGIQVDHLLSKAYDGSMVVIEEQEYDPVALLALFVKKSFHLFGLIASMDKIEILVITTRLFDARMVDVLEQVVGALGLRTNRIFFQNYAESFYNYMLHQSRDLWKGKSIIFDYGRDFLRGYFLEYNTRTTPVVAFVQEKEWEQYRLPEWPEEEAALQMEKEQLDERFLMDIRPEFQNQFITAVYLVGDGFEGEWAEKSLQFLCRGRRVFRGNNLYSKGAAYSAMEKLCPSEAGKQHVFLGREKLKANIGLQVVKDGQESYKALIDAGVNWYDVKGAYQFILESGDSFMMTVTPLAHVFPEKTPAGKYPVRNIEIELRGLPERPKRATRLEIRFYMKDVEHLEIEVEDLGFGEIIKGTHHVWTKEIVTSEIVTSGEA